MNESEYTLREITSQDQEILIGPKRLTRFEKAKNNWCSFSTDIIWRSSYD